MCLVRGCGSKVRLRRGGVVISLCHRCISLEYLWFYTRVTQLCVFAFSLKQRDDSCRSFREKSVMIVTKLISREREDMQDWLSRIGVAINCYMALSFQNVFVINTSPFTVTSLHAAVTCNTENSWFTMPGSALYTQLMRNCTCLGQCWKKYCDPLVIKSTNTSECENIIKYIYIY